MPGNFSGGSFSGAVGGFSVDSVVQNSGGYYDGPHGQRRTAEDTQRDRERFGFPAKAVAVIEAVAVRQAEDLRLDERQRLEELAGELKLAGIEYQTAYLDALNAQRQALIDVEISRWMHQVQDNESALIVLIMAAM